LFGTPPLKAQFKKTGAMLREPPPWLRLCAWRYGATQIYVSFCV